MLDIHQGDTLTHPRRARTRARIFQAGTAAAAALAVAAAGGQSFAAGTGTTTTRAETGHHAGAPTPRGFYDSSRGRSGAAQARDLRNASRVNDRPATARFRAALPSDAVLDIDGSTGSVRMLTRLDGFLTGRSSANPQSVVRKYVGSHRAALGIPQVAMSQFKLVRSYRDITGVRHLYFHETVSGHTVYSKGLTAAVDPRGRLLTVGGSPVNRTTANVAAPSRITTARQAILAARARLGDPNRAVESGDRAVPVLFVTPSGSHTGWWTVITSSAHQTSSVLDATTGRVLMRRPLSSDVSAEGAAYQYFPGARRGGTQVPVDFTRRGWLGPNARSLSGNNSHTYSDVNDNDNASPSEEVPPRTPHRWDYRLKPFFPSSAATFCGKPYPCSWNPDKAGSWRTNRAQNATQVFFYVNNWHDHLLAAPIGFTEAAGNFENVNATGQGRGSDAVETQTDDGANLDHGLPDGNHVDNANMSTPPDGQAPTMQMYLQHTPGTSYPDEDPFAPTNVGDEADTVYHEYTHGLSDRLVVDVQGGSTLGPVQGGAMGEAWSDWYAMDYLVHQGLQRDKPGVADVVLYQYDGVGRFYDRTEPIDCAVKKPSRLCTGGATGHGAGYTYLDYGKVAGGPEVHGDGEIWAQTLWTLRAALGSATTESLVTRAMELAPADPSFLDMRNAILVADTSVYGGAHHAAIWKTFARRGMGFFAGSLGGEDAEPGASFVVPPTSRTRGSVAGTVTDSRTHQPLAGVPVTLAFQGSGTANPTSVTDAQGHYRIGPVPAGRYRKLTVNGGGVQPTTRAVTVTAGTTVVDLAARRDWAAASGGAAIIDANGTDYTPDCGPDLAIDLSRTSGWVTNAGPDDNPTTTVVPKHVTVDLGRAIDITDYGVDPTAACGAGLSASTGSYTIETSSNGVDFSPSVSGTFTGDDLGRLNDVTPTGATGNVRYVRFTITGNQTPDPATNCPDGGYDGCIVVSMSELEVFGTPTP